MRPGTQSTFFLKLCHTCYCNLNIFLKSCLFSITLECIHLLQITVTLQNCFGLNSDQASKHQISLYFKIATNLSNICRINKRANQSIPVIVNYYSCNAARFMVAAHLLTEWMNCSSPRFPSSTTTGAGMGYLPWISQSSCRLCRSFKKEIGRPSSSFIMNSKM